jgi:hypothetical protein
VVSKLTTVIIFVSSTVPVIALSIIINIITDTKENNGHIYCYLDILNNPISKPLGVVLNLIIFINLIILVYCYFNISLHYYRILSLWELENNTSVNNESEYTVEKPKTKTTQKLIILAKVQIIMVIFIVEILPGSIIHILNYFIQIPQYPVWDTWCIFLMNCVPLTNPLFVLFLHFETFQEFKFLALIAKMKVKKLFKKYIFKI